ncbi:S8 family peptidase [Halegenticoccus soli]|uniref:S8 family peptidase n=1 Tax=Halegenticoccus soli TaxID=1985678 RepID=UPI000C6F0176|nr:S8 family peptidase [Halegenticoccus soli]
MLHGDGQATRRNVLKAVGGTVGSTGIVGLASASEGATIEVNVGYAGKSGRRAARSEARSIRREFAFDALTITVNENAIPGLRRRKDVRYVEENGSVYALRPGKGGTDVDGSSTGQTLPWGIDRVDAEVAHGGGYTGAGADVAIIDTGIDSDHPDLQANLGEGKAFVSCRGGTCNEPWDDDNDHGTHCAGTADAVDNDEGVVGVSTEATLHAVKVLDKRGSGTFSDVAAGVEWTADQGYDVGSMSLGASSGSQTLKDACSYAYERGVLLVAAAGNSGPCSDCVGYPAAYDECIAVSATSEDDSLASFSSTGPEVELAAPGEDVYSTVPGGYDTFSGTSMACPHVAGAGALLMAEGYTNAEARQRLRDTAEDLGLASNEQGYGLLDAAAALGLDSSDN